MCAVGNREAGSEVLVEHCTGDMFSKLIQGLTLTSNAGHQGEIMAVIRDILVRSEGLPCTITWDGDAPLLLFERDCCQGGGLLVPFACVL